MNEIHWPDPEGILAYLRARMASEGAELRVASQSDLIAGFERARTASAYHDPDLCHLAAMMFDGIATRHPLVDGNKRLAWLGAVVFLDLNGLYLDAPEVVSFDIGMAVIALEKSNDDLAEFFRKHAIPDDPG